MRTFPKIEMPQGLTNSFEVLKRIKKDKTLNKYRIFIGTFTNCRELGLTFIVQLMDNGFDSLFTFCVYEHRNSDSIIINGKKGMVSLNGDLPYISDNKYDYLGSATYKDYDGAAKILSDKIKELVV
jgi:hypothetical protein